MKPKGTVLLALPAHITLPTNLFAIRISLLCLRSYLTITMMGERAVASHPQDTHTSRL